MTALNAYLARYFYDEAQIARASGIDAEAHAALVRDQLVPGPSYEVSAAGKLSSYVFGAMDAPGAAPGRYFHPSQAVWIARANEASQAGAPQTALKRRFTAAFGAALAELDRSTWRLPDSFDAQGTPISAGLALRTESAWLHFIKGTFGLCVANPVSEQEIARKEVLQEKLTQLSDNGSRAVYPAPEAAFLRALIDAYAAAAMPFSPVEYPISSRKRLVEDLLVKLRVAQEAQGAQEAEQGIGTL